MKQNSLAIIGAVFTALLSTICCLPALLFLLFGGFKWLTSQGSSDKIDEAKKLTGVS